MESPRIQLFREVWFYAHLAMNAYRRYNKDIKE